MRAPMHTLHFFFPLLERNAHSTLLSEMYFDKPTRRHVCRKICGRSDVGLAQVTLDSILDDLFLSVTDIPSSLDIPLDTIAVGVFYRRNVFKFYRFCDARVYRININTQLQLSEFSKLPTIVELWF